MGKRSKKLFSTSLQVIIIIAVCMAMISVWYSPNSYAQHNEKESHLSSDDATIMSIESEQAHNKKVEKEEFKAGDMIFDHILDAHEWHFATLPSGYHVTIYLPIILWYQGNLHVFSSSHFAHGHSYESKGVTFNLDANGENKGKIVSQKEPFTEDEIIASGDSLPLDFSITKNVAAIFISALLMLWLFVSVARSYTKQKGKAPKGLQSFVEPIIIFIRDDIAKPSLGEKRSNRYLPFLLTVFFFIFINNLLGMIPGWANVTGNISVTLVLALFTFFITTFSGNKAYWKHIFNAPGVPWWLKFPVPLMPLVEFIGVITKPFVLMVRLFANMTAGHIIVLGFVSLIFIFGNNSVAMGYGVSPLSILMGVFISVLELLVAFIQAYVFTLLSALYFGMATEEEHH